MGKRRNLSKRRSFKRRSNLFKRRSNLSKRRSFKRKRTQKRRNNMKRLRMKGGSTKEDKRVLEELKKYVDFTFNYDDLPRADKEFFAGVVDLKVSPELQKLFEYVDKPLNLLENKVNIYTTLNAGYSEDDIKKEIEKKLLPKHYKETADMLFYKIFSDYDETDGNMKFEDYCRKKLNDEEFKLISAIYSELLTQPTETAYHQRPRLHEPTTLKTIQVQGV